MTIFNSNAEVWMHDNSIAVVIPQKDGAGVVQMYTTMPNPAETPFLYAGIRWFSMPIKAHRQVQNSRRYLERNLF